jgi:hypothetical protein
MDTSVARHSTTTTHPGSWWARPEVQRDRAAFAAALAGQLARMLDDKNGARMVDAMQADSMRRHGGAGRRSSFTSITTAWSAR